MIGTSQAAGSQAHSVDPWRSPSLSQSPFLPLAVPAVTSTAHRPGTCRPKTFSADLSRICPLPLGGLPSVLQPPLPSVAVSFPRVLAGCCWQTLRLLQQPCGSPSLPRYQPPPAFVPQTSSLLGSPARPCWRGSGGETRISSTHPCPPSSPLVKDQATSFPLPSQL